MKENYDYFLDKRDTVILLTWLTKFSLVKTQWWLRHSDSVVNASKYTSVP